MSRVFGFGRNHSRQLQNHSSCSYAGLARGVFLGGKDTILGKRTGAGEQGGSAELGCTLPKAHPRRRSAEQLQSRSAWAQASHFRPRF